MTDETPDTITFPARLARPDQTFEYADGGGTLHSLVADEDGHVQPTNSEEDAIFAMRGLPRIEADPDGPSYKQLQKRAHKLEIPASGNKAKLSAAIEARENELAAQAVTEPDADDTDNAEGTEA